VIFRGREDRYWFFPSPMFLGLAASSASRGRTTLVRGAGLGVLLLTTIGVIRKWIYPSWPESHFNANVERFKGFNAGPQMTFSVYDPGGRTMELVKK
jgi:hypothetical protein